MNELNIKLELDRKCKLVAVDETDYSNLLINDIVTEIDLTKHVSVEFLVYYEEVSPLKSLIKEVISSEEVTFDLNYDGTYTYYKLIVPKLERLVKYDVSAGIYNIIELKDQSFYWDGNFYKGKENLIVSGTDINVIITENINFILNNQYSEKITNYLDIYENVLNNLDTQTLTYQKIVFTVCHLENCLVSLQKQILNSPKNCLECDLDVNVRYRRDFILSSLYVFDYLKDIENYDEAQRLLENLATCTSLCEDDSINNNCGCGNVSY